LTEDECGALLQHVYEFAGILAAGSVNSANPIFHSKPLFLNIVTMQWAKIKIKEGLAYLSLDLIYDLKG
jgi:hypothetical protein